MTTDDDDEATDDIRKEKAVMALETTCSKAQAALAQLDKEYCHLDIEEKKLKELLQKTKEEQECLERALQEACETGAQRRAREMKQKEDAAVARMANALFESDSSDEEETTTLVGDDDIQTVSV